MRSPIEAFEEHLRNRPEGISPYTVRGYLADLKKFGEWFKATNDENMRLRNVTPVDVRDYKMHLQIASNFKSSTINRRLSSLRAYFSWAIQEGLIKENPVRVRNLGEPQRAPRSLDERLYHRLLRAVQQLMGHKRVDSTARYTKPSERDMEVAVARLELEEA